jgi:type VI secretion system protein VasD
MSDHRAIVHHCRMRRRSRAAALVLGAAVLLAGCASAPKPTLASATLQASATVNPDVRRRPSPLMVRVYELKSTASFDAADFLSLYERDQATLAADMASREEIMLKPGDSRSWDKTLSPDTRFIAVFAAFRDIDRARWKGTTAVVPNARNMISVTADGVAITIKRVSP